MKGIEEKIIDGVKQYRAYFEVDGETHWQPSYGSLSKALNYRDVLERAFPLKSTLPKKVSRSVADPTKVGSAKFTKAAGVAHIIAGGYFAYLNINGEKYRKGGFKTADEAYQWRLKLAKEHGIEKLDKETTLNPTGYEGVYERKADYYNAYLKWEGKMHRKDFRTFDEALKYRKYLEEKYWTPHHRGVVKEKRGWRAQYPGYSKWFATHEEAVNQREKWESEFGEPVWGTPPEDLSGKIFGNLKAISYAGSRKVAGKKAGAMWLCENTVTGDRNIYRATDLKSGAANGRPMTENAKKGRQAIEASKVDGVPLARYSDTPRKDNETGYRGVSLYRGKYRARLTVKGKDYTMIGFDTPEEAYYQGRLVLEQLHLPKTRHKKKSPEN